MGHPAPPCVFRLMSSPPTSVLFHVTIVSPTLMAAAQPQRRRAEKESAMNIVDWENTYFMTKYYVR